MRWQAGDEIAGRKIGQVDPTHVFATSLSIETATETEISDNTAIRHMIHPSCRVRNGTNSR